MDIEKYSKISPQFYSNIIPSLLKKYLNNDNIKIILDCGCGDGAMLYALKNAGYFNNRNIVAIDLSQNRIELVKKIDNKIIAFVDSAESLKNIDDNSIDLLITTQVIEHVDDKKMTNQMYRVLKDNGIIYLTTIYKKWYGWYFYRCNGKWVIDPTHIREYTNDNQLFDLFKNKFKVLENIKSLNFYPIIDFIIKRININNRFLFTESKVFSILRKIKIPIFGYYHWEIILKK